MALNIKLNARIATGCTELVVSEQTGTYNALTNLTGYGAPNPITGDVSIASLTVTSPSLQVYTIDLLATSLFPSSNTTLNYVIPMSLLGNRTFIEDGQWSFIYTVVMSTSEDIYTIAKSYIFTCNARCCVSKLKAQIDVRECDTYRENNKTTMRYLKAEAFLAALEDAAFCGNITEYTKIKTILDRLCVNTGCKTCN